MPHGPIVPLASSAVQPPTPWQSGGAALTSIPAPQPVPAQQGFLKSLSAPKAAGVISFEPREAQEEAPRDLSRTLVVLSVSLAFLGILVVFIAATIVVATVLICLGAGALLFVVPLILMLLKTPFDALLGGLKKSKPVTVVRFRLEDDLTGGPVDVVLRRKMGEGSCVFQGDRVQVWGRRKAGTLYAAKLRVESSGATVKAQKPWPLWIGLLSLALVIAGLVVLAIETGLIQVGS